MNVGVKYGFSDGYPIPGRYSITEYDKISLKLRVSQLAIPLICVRGLMALLIDVVLLCKYVLFVTKED